MKQQHNPYSLDTATLSWDDNGVPSAETYGDVYFSRDNGIEESRYVFLQHNRLTERWSNLNPNTPGHFTIFETGFGSGLNFLLAWQLWLQLAPQNWRLHYISVEKHPMRPADLRAAHSHWPELAELASILQQKYPPLLPGQHRRSLSAGTVCLDLLFGDLHDMLPALADADWAIHLTEQRASPSLTDNSARPIVDAWFLDGFAPSTNPAMWQEPLYTAMATLSGRGSSYATFTSAGVVKRGLRSAGFKVNKVKGYGRKREMLCGDWQQLPQESSDTPAPEHSENVLEQLAPLHTWHCPASRGEIKHIAVIGAGLAGCSTANALATRGYRVTVLERGAQPAGAASGNPQGMLYTKLSPDPGPLNQFTLSSFLYALSYYREALTAANPPEGELCGVLQIAGSDRDEQHFAALAEMLEKQDWLQYLPAGSLPNIHETGLDFPLPRAAHFYPGAGWLSPASLCNYWLDHEHIQLHCGAEVTSLQQQGDGWVVAGANDTELCRADAVVIATAHDALNLAESAFLPLRPIRGQISYLPEDAIPYEINTVICHDGYLAPPVNGRYCIGASFDLKNPAPELLEADHDWNRQQLRKLLPELADRELPILGGRAALRCASPDYMPIVGALPIPEDFDRDYGRLRKDARTRIETRGRYQQNLYINVAHGSRGLTSTPLCAELLASYIGGEVRPLARELCEHLSPARFLIRDLIRNRR